MILQQRKFFHATVIPLQFSLEIISCYNHETLQKSTPQNKFQVSIDKFFKLNLFYCHVSALLMNTKETVMNIFLVENLLRDCDSLEDNDADLKKIWGIQNVMGFWDLKNKKKLEKNAKVTNLSNTWNWRWNVNNFKLSSQRASHKRNYHIEILHVLTQHVQTWQKDLILQSNNWALTMSLMEELEGSNETISLSFYVVKSKITSAKSRWKLCDTTHVVTRS